MIRNEELIMWQVIEYAGLENERCVKIAESFAKAAQYVARQYTTEETVDMCVNIVKNYSTEY